MTHNTIVLRLNQQQLELLDRTVARGVAPDRTALIRLALKEYGQAHQGNPVGDKPTYAGALK